MLSIRWDNKQTNNQKALSFKGVKVPTPVVDNFNAVLKNPFIKTVDVYCHGSPDDDTVNSAAPIIRLFQKFGKNVNVCVNKLKTKALYYSPKDIKKDLNPADATFVLDFNSFSKVPTSFKNLFKTVKSETIFGFDHHPKSADSFAGNVYIDESAKSCSSVIFRLLEGLGGKFSKRDLKNIYCGMLSDFQKSKLVKIENGKLIKTEYLEKDKNSKEILEKVEAKLNDKDKARIISHLDVMSNLKPLEKKFLKRIFSEIQVSQNGKFAYLAIDPQDKDWLALGQDNFRTSEFLRYLRLKLINNVQASELFTAEQKAKMKDLKGAVVFYRAGSVYQYSVHTKPDGFDARELRLIAKPKFEAYSKEKDSNLEIEGGGHVGRAGGRIHSIEKEDVNQFVKSFMDAFEKIV